MRLIASLIVITLHHNPSNKKYQGHSSQNAADCRRYS